MFVYVPIHVNPVLEGRKSWEGRVAEVLLWLVAAGRLELVGETVPAI